MSCGRRRQDANPKPWTSVRSRHERMSRIGKNDRRDGVALADWTAEMVVRRTRQRWQRPGISSAFGSSHCAQDERPGGSSRAGCRPQCQWDRDEKLQEHGSRHDEGSNRPRHITGYPRCSSRQHWRLRYPWRQYAHDEATMQCGGLRCNPRLRFPSCQRQQPGPAICLDMSVDRSVGTKPE